MFSTLLSVELIILLTPIYLLENTLEKIRYKNSVQDLYPYDKLHCFEPWSSAPTTAAPLASGRQATQRLRIQ